MRIRTAFAAAAGVAAAAAVNPVAPVAASAPVAVPGNYLIANAGGSCLQGDGGRNAKARLGACDTTWEVARRGEGFTIVHPATGHCLSMGLERIYPPFVSTLPCDGARPWTIADSGDGRVTISLGTGSALLTGQGIGRRIRLLPAEKECQEQQRWILKPV